MAWLVPRESDPFSRKRVLTPFEAASNLAKGNIVLAAPVLWACGVLVFVYCPLLLFEAIRGRLNKTK